MSQEKVEIVKEFTRLFEQGDRDVRRKYFDPDLVWDTSASNMPSADVLHGHEGVERSSATGLELGGLRNATREYLDAGVEGRALPHVSRASRPSMPPGDRSRHVAGERSQMPRSALVRPTPPLGVTLPPMLAREMG
jgi:hypothetical protein